MGEDVPLPNPHQFKAKEAHQYSQLAMTFSLTAEQVEQFERDGCLCLPDFLTREEVNQLLARTKELITDFDISTHPMTKFTTGTKGEEHVGDAYFLESSDKVSFFFEPNAFDEKNQLTKPKEKAINKIGHGLHMNDELFRSQTINEKNLEIVQKLGFQDPRVLQSMVICKQPEIGGEVPSHQDGVFLYTEPQSAVGFWFALEDCTTDNGCLSFLPGSHKTNPIVKRFVRKEGGGTGFEMINGEEEKYANTEKDYTLLDCKAGSLVLIHNSVLHRSNPNVGLKSRYAYAFHVIDGVTEYDGKNWLQVPYTGGSDFTKLAL